MRFENLVDLHRAGQSAISYKLTIDDLRMVVLISGEDISLFEIIFVGVQSHAFVPDDLSNYRAHIDLDSLQRAIGKHWINELRVPSEVHRKYLEEHEFYVLHVSDIGQFEVVALSVQFNDLGSLTNTQ